MSRPSLRSRSFRLTLAAILLSAGWAGATETPPACPPEAQPPSPTEIAQGLGNARDRGFLWRVSRDNRTSYLYGTVHVGRPEWMFPGPAALSALRSTEVLALELDVLDPVLLQRLQEGMAPRPERTLPESLIARLRAQLRAACLPDDLLTTTSPEMVATTLTMMSARKAGLDPTYGVDAAYAGLARGLNKPVASLETPELQLELLLGSSLQETQAAVESALEELESGSASPMVSRMAQIWAEGRLGELERYETWCDCMETESDRVLMRRLLEDRNPGLADRIDAIHTSGRPVFAAVGSLHMVGTQGLPSLLAARGYRVERVDFKP